MIKRTKSEPVVATDNITLPDRWTPLKPHDKQRAVLSSKKRFKVVPAGRRAGKSEIAKRNMALEVVFPQSSFSTPRYFMAAPVRHQCKQIFWNDMQALIPDYMIVDKSTSDLILFLANGAELHFLGLDSPERIEGQPWDGGVVDEIANVKAHAWGAHIRPALADRQGWCWLIGVPEGRNHYYKMFNKALPQTEKFGFDHNGVPYEWGAWTWKSSDILPASEIAAARDDLDDLTFKQEYEAEFSDFAGRAYYAFTPDNYKHELTYNTGRELIFCFDFNVSPGVAAVCQEQIMPYQMQWVDNGGGVLEKEPVYGTGVIGEVWIPRNSNTLSVCKKLYKDWKHHQGFIKVYGDATGGSKGSAKLSGSDWEIIKNFFATTDFCDRIQYNVGRSNPSERSRVNAVNSRCCSASGIKRLMVEQAKAPHVVEDFEGVILLEGGSGEIDKKHDDERTHILDALGYYIAEEFPVDGDSVTSEEF